MPGCYCTTISKDFFKKKFGYFFAIGFLGFQLQGCNSHVDKKTNVDQTLVTLGVDAKIGYSVVGNYVMSSCKDCHSGSRQPTLNSYNQVVANLTKILSEVEQDKMPKKNAGYNELNVCQKAILHRWATTGTPIEGTELVSTLADCQGFINRPVVIEIPLKDAPLKYDVLYSRILQKKCSSCHALATDSDATDLPVYPMETFLSHRTWFKKAKNGKIKILHAVSRTDEHRMPPKPKPDDPNAKDTPLTPEEIDYLTRYVTTALPVLPDPIKPPEPSTDEKIPLKNAPLDYETLYSRIFQPKCIKCHWEGGESHAADIPVFPADKFLSHKTWFKKDEDSPSGEQSKVIFAVTRTDKERMPPPPKPNDPNGKDNPLTDEEVDYLTRWIQSNIK